MAVNVLICNGFILIMNHQCMVMKYLELQFQSVARNIIIIIIIFINCNWVITQWQWLYYMYTNMERKKK